MAAFQQHYGQENRGGYLPIKANTAWGMWPDYVKQCIFVDDPPSLVPKRIFDDLIYLHGSTCADEIGLTMTFAHELQHFVQHSLTPKLWAENKLIPELPTAVTNASWGLQWSDIPVEREAVAKRTAESLCGLEQVKDYVSRKINNSVKPSDLADWKFIQSLQTVTDLTDATRQVFQRLKRYRSELEQVLMQHKNDPDFADIELEALIG